MTSFVEYLMSFHFSLWRENLFGAMKWINIYGSYLIKDKFLCSCCFWELQIAGQNQYIYSHVFTLGATSEQRNAAMEHVLRGGRRRVLVATIITGEFSVFHSTGLITDDLQTFVVLKCNLMFVDSMSALQICKCI